MLLKTYISRERSLLQGVYKTIQIWSVRSTYSVCGGGVELVGAGATSVSTAADSVLATVTVSSLPLVSSSSAVLANFCGVGASVRPLRGRFKALPNENPAAGTAVVVVVVVVVVAEDAAAAAKRARRWLRRWASDSTGIAVAAAESFTAV